MAAREECTCGKIPYQWARLVDPECKAVHHDETHGYHTADGEPVPGPSDVVAELREYVKLSRGYDGVPRTVLVKVIAEIERLQSYLKDKECGGIEKLKYIQRLEAENTKLREFFEAVFEAVWDMSDPDGGDLQDAAERLGLIVRVPADEQFRDEYDADEMFVWVWHPLAAEALNQNP